MSEPVRGRDTFTGTGGEGTPSEQDLVPACECGERVRSNLGETCYSCLGGEE